MKIGDTVKLISGSPIMTIVDTHMLSKKVTCRWFAKYNTENYEDGSFRTTYIRPEALELVKQ